jgi:hypothetical protein
MDVRGVVPDARKLGRRSVEDDRPAHEHQALDVALDRAELVRDVENRHAEVGMEPCEELAERLLALRIDPGSRLVEREQPGTARERLRYQRPLLLAARETSQLGVRPVGEPHELDRLVDALAVGPTQPADDPAGRERPRGDDLPHRHGRIEHERSALRQVSEHRAPREPLGRLPVEAHDAGVRPLEAEDEPEERRLPASVRACDRDELTLADPQIHVT